jgi:hypothetical protein
VIGLCLTCKAAFGDKARKRLFYGGDAARTVPE